MAYLLGVINITTNRYENIISVNKSNKYKCIGCNSELILRKGEKNFQSFVHKNQNGCCYFKNPTQQQLLHDAMLYLQKIVEDNTVDIFRKCKDCNSSYKMTIPEYNNTNMIMFGDKNHVIVLDDTGNTICRFKMYSSIPNEDLENDCYHINMLDLIHRCVMSFATKHIELICSKSIICDECISYQTKYT